MPRITLCAEENGKHFDYIQNINNKEHTATTIDVNASHIFEIYK